MKRVVCIVNFIATENYAVDAGLFKNDSGMTRTQFVIAEAFLKL